MGAAVAFATLLSHWRRRPWQGFMLIIGLAAATALFSGVQALNFQARQSYDQAERQLGGVGVDVYVSVSGAPFDEAAFSALRRRGILVSPLVEGRVVVGGSVFTALGVDLATAPREGVAGGVTGGRRDGPAPAEFLAPPYVMIGSEETIRVLGDARATDEGAPLPRSISVDGVAPYTLIMDIGAAQELLDLRGKLTKLIAPQQGDAPDRLDGEGVALVRIDGGDTAGAGALTGSFHLNLTAFGFLSFLVGLLIVRSAVGLAFEQRTPVFRTMRACGVTTSNLTIAIVFEALTAALIAGGIGALAGYAIAAAILPDVALTLRGLYGANVSGDLAVRPAWFALALAMSVIGALAASADGVLRLRALAVLEAGRPLAWIEAANRAGRRNGTLAFVAILIGFAAARFGDGLLAGFVVLGAALAAAALVLPILLSSLARWFERRSSGAVTRWFWADARQQLPSVTLAFQALLIALAANIGVGAMVGGFRDTFVGWLDQRLSAEAFVRIEAPIDPVAVDRWLADRREVSRALAFGNVRGRANGERLSILAFVDDKTYRDNWPLIAAAPEAWERVAAGKAALVNEQMFRRRGVGVGDSIDIETPTGSWTVDVAGVYSDYGNPASQAMANIEEIRARWPSFDPRFRLVRLSPEATAEDLRRFMQDAVNELDLAEDAIIDQQALKRFSVDIFERTFSVTAALNVLTLAISGVAMLTALSALSGARLAMAAPVWAMGLTRSELSRWDFLKTLALSAFTAMLAVPLGVFVAWVLTAVVNVEAFGWRLPLRHYPADWARLWCIALVIAGFASAPSAIRLRRATSASLLKAFCAER